MILLSACTRSTVALPTTSPTEQHISNDLTPLAETSTPEKTPFIQHEAEHAVVWIPEDESLKVRHPAGISGTIVYEIPYDARGVYLLEQSTLLGSSLWREIEYNADVTGWVQAWNLTEFMAPETFCEDDRAEQLLAKFTRAVIERDAEALMKVINPERGLVIRHNWYNTDILFTSEDQIELFLSQESLDWGQEADSGLPIQGSFTEIIAPKLDDVFLKPFKLTCRELQWGSTAGEVLWPSEFDNMNYYGLYRPAKPNGNEFDWRSWGIGMEYLEGEPYISLLIHYSSEF